MKKAILLILIYVFTLNGYSQNFYREDFNPKKKYVILTNPTVRNLQTIRYLQNANLLNIKNSTRFVGVYFEDQNYDFGQTKTYIEKNNLKKFHLHEVKGELNEQNIFEGNDCTPDLKTIFNNSVGVFFFGGPDIPPAVYGEENTLSIVTDPQRHYFETTFIFHLLGGFWNEDFTPLINNNPDYLVTGFCLGMQTLNVATGGTLIQDIPAEVFGAKTPESALKIGRANLHRNYWQEIERDSLLMGINLHTIRFSENNFFTKKVGVPRRWEPRIYSSHHQAAEKLGKGLEVTALSPDGKIIEGLVHKYYPNVFAVQFHPEVAGLYEDLYVRKFHPRDEPKSYNDIIGNQSVKFHEKYWNYISGIIRKAKVN